ncbi:ATP-dependent zinc metalloprotease FtsH [Mariniblastus fucicola]|uniref:ATP-dependent zinc metalloprotease FtsH n=1 Tax=Mariniblastus fucicola TaxID=980251 RepID=A0A5B9PLZ6_9BACT|nr:ATP-dependent zinc metalloprotease FtsH [Mariniblastus fucicola]QEG23313.1 ATP-dependent zinc metalloprotease FtsH [Mariniblastus fucicola]
MDDKEARNNRENENEQGARPPMRGFPIWLLVSLLMMFLLYTLLYPAQRASRISYGYFEKLIEGNDPQGKSYKDGNGDEIGSMIESVEIGPSSATGTFKVIPDPEPTFNTSGELVPPKDTEKLEKHFIVEIGSLDEMSRADLMKTLRAAGVEKVSFEQQTQPWVYQLLFLALMTLGIIGIMMFMMRRQSQMMGGGGFLSNFSRSTAKRYEPNEAPVTFKDVAGLEGVKADLQEIVDFLKDPTKFQKLGGRVPKGVLLVGPPGTGKTLLARAVAGEANVPYFNVNGSEFIQMFVGVGASRVRDLFAQAKEQSPAIIFIDEIDAVGRQRGAGLGGGHDEREQTLNQILGEMDGFDKTDSVIILAATNRPDILDPALLRPGRFDRHVTVSRPTKAGRFAIFKVHVRDVPLSDDVDLEAMAEATAGMTGADIQNLVNEAALWAARKNKNKVEMDDFYHAHDKVLMGAAREEVLTEKEKERTAYHEAGHTIAAWFLDGGSPVHKVTIIPRGQALGVTQMVHDEDRMNLSEQEIRDHLIMLLAGRGAESIIYDELTVGAENDLERATSMARRMVTHWGMSEKLGPVSYKMSDEDPFLGREMQKSRLFSEHTMEVIDEEVHRILSEAQQAANDLLLKHRDNLQAITDGLMKNEELDRYEIADLIGPSVHGELVRPGRAKSEPSKNGTATSQDEVSQSDSETNAESETKTETASDQT